jgi:16S rRNA (guanine(1405)-N(7))-methyltransferase
MRTNSARPELVEGRAASHTTLSVTDVVRAVQQSRRYQWVAPAVLERLAAEEIPKSRNPAEAQKRTKRRLHQIFGAYTRSLPYAAIASAIDSLTPDTDRRELERTCKWVLEQHASTRERLPLLESFYREIFRRTGQPIRLLDVACGLNPFALPWMGLDVGCTYLAYDIDVQLSSLIDAFLARLGIPHQVDVVDVLAPLAPPAADVALLLKTVPCLEQQRSGAGLEVLDRIDAPYVVVSYPTRSLGGHGKGMARTYRAQFGALLAQRPWRAQEIEFSTELVFVIEKAR